MLELGLEKVGSILIVSHRQRILTHCSLSVLDDGWFGEYIKKSRSNTLRRSHLFFIYFSRYHIAFEGKPNNLLQCLAGRPTNHVLSSVPQSSTSDRECICMALHWISGTVYTTSGLHKLMDHKRGQLTGQPTRCAQKIGVPPPNHLGSSKLPIEPLKR